MHFSNRVVDVSVIILRQIPPVQAGQNMVEVPQVHFINKVANVPVRQIPAVPVAHTVEGVRPRDHAKANSSSSSYRNLW